MQGGNSHRQGPEVGEGPCLCSREGRPVWPGLAGRGEEQTDTEGARGPIRLGSCCVRKGGWAFQSPSGCSVENGRLQGCRREAEEVLPGAVETEMFET